MVYVRLRPTRHRQKQVKGTFQDINVFKLNSKQMNFLDKCDMIKQNDSKVVNDMLQVSEMIFYLNILCKCQCKNQAHVAST